MTFFEELTAHKGWLILLKTQLFWYGGRGYDGIRGRVCLLMDAADLSPGNLDDGGLAAETATGAHLAVYRERRVTALILIDGRPQWVWVSSDDLELIT